MVAISLAFRGRTGRNRDGPPLSDVLVETTRSPCLSFAFPANIRHYILHVTSGVLYFFSVFFFFFFFIATRHVTPKSHRVPAALGRAFSSIIIGIDGIRLPPLAASPDARLARCCEREPRPIDILSPVPSRAAASFPRLAYPRMPCLSVNVRETIVQIVAQIVAQIEAGDISWTLDRSCNALR